MGHYWNGRASWSLREELRERLWPSETFVNFERSLNAAVAKLRQVLADSAEQPRYVETVARRGYRFVAPVEAILELQETAGLPLDSVAGEADGSISRRKRERWVWPAAALTLLVLVSAGIYLLQWRPLASYKTDAVSLPSPRQREQKYTWHQRYRRMAANWPLLRWIVPATGHSG